MELGKCTGGEKRPDAKKPPLAPKRKRRVPVVLYLDDEYWDARMSEVD